MQEEFSITEYTTLIGKRYVKIRDDLLFIRVPEFMRSENGWGTVMLTM